MEELAKQRDEVLYIKVDVEWTLAGGGQFFPLLATEDKVYAMPFYVFIKNEKKVCN